MENQNMTNIYSPTASLGDLVVELLKAKPSQEISSKDLAALVLENFPEWCSKKQQNSKPGVKLLSQLANEISSRRPQWLKKYPDLKCSDTSPRHYSWGPSLIVPQGVEDEASGVIYNEPKLSEADLYPILAHFLWVGPAQNAVYPKRINEKTSSNNLGPKANEWLHPDMVGLEDLMSDWNPQIQDCAEKAGDQRARLWAFEVKIKVSRSSVRRDYFQAVSNSSWANFGYLVAAEIDTDAETELRMLHGLHGIGLIELDTGNPAESVVRIPARERHIVDWTTCNRLAKENKDFRYFAKLVSHFYKTRETSEKEWDIPSTIPDKE
ncbi:HrgA protein [Azotobacter beijerinckii]|uniref:HrgA protein n=1 Tax=Azotobacter beijerinckii TaxID=170623 RepID=UPI002952FCD5|nr:HrgA protein [Azotobacter beijerinckii]MDV7210775.1 HrgA protein [Azotobacter beijerinckii]